MFVSTTRAVLKEEVSMSGWASSNEGKSKGKVAFGFFIAGSPAF